MSTDIAARLRLRPLKRTDLIPAQAISASFHWPHRVEDWEFMLGLGRGWAAEQDGVLVGTGVSWLYGEADAALGLICVDHARHGKGIGRSLLRALLDGVEGRRVVLHSTEDGLQLYVSLGFAPTGRIRQHQGAAFQPPLMPLRAGERVRPTGRSDPALLTALDREASGVDRRELIAGLLQVGTAVVLDVEGRATGFAILRRFGIGQVIGPVVAPDAAGARALIGHFLAANPGQFMRVDVPEESGLSSWLQSLGLADAGGGVRMERGVGLERPRTFALASQALG